jgi:hypothetical protein
MLRREVLRRAVSGRKVEHVKSVRRQPVEVPDDSRLSFCGIRARPAEERLDGAILARRRPEVFGGFGNGGIRELLPGLLGGRDRGQQRKYDQGEGCCLQTGAGVGLVTTRSHARRHGNLRASAQKNGGRKCLPPPPHYIPPSRLSGRVKTVSFV